MAKVVVEYVCADPEGFRRLSGTDECREGRKEVGEVIGYGQCVVAKVFELAGLVAPLRRGVHLRDLHSEPERFHESLLSRQAFDDRRERVDRAVLDHVVRHLPAFAPFLE